MDSGLRLKRINTVVSLSFLIPAAILMYFHPASVALALLSFPLGLVWANWFEYFYHRWLDHTPGLYFERRHRDHHREPDDDMTVTLGKGWETFGMFMVNSVPMVALSLWTGINFAAPVLVAFVVYVLTVEEVHWRVHMGGRLPGWARAHHLSHHGMGEKPTGARTKYNIFLPLFDWIFGTIG